MPIYQHVDRKVRFLRFSGKNKADAEKRHSESVKIKKFSIAGSLPLLPERHCMMTAKTAIMLKKNNKYTA
jgi:hypothetical protein